MYPLPPISNQTQPSLIGRMGHTGWVLIQIKENASNQYQLPTLLWGPGCFQAKPPSGLTLGSEPSLLSARVPSAPSPFPGDFWAQATSSPMTTKASRTKTVTVFMLVSGVVQGQSPAKIYTLTVTRKEGGVGGGRAGRGLKYKLSRECPRIFQFPCSISQLFSQTRKWFLVYANTKLESLGTFF